MRNAPRLPFQVGQEAEAKTFEKGFRSAWFRCKIHEIKEKKGYSTEYLLEYYDYPDEAWDWTKIYQIPPYCTGKGKEKNRQLMLRPPYPPIYKKNQMPDVNVNSDVAVIVDDSWKVGDLVDWWTTDCHWPGKIIELLGDDEAKMKLVEPPIGEGSVYDVKLKDVRPSLNWSLKFGWTLPIRDDDPGRFCAQLVRPTVTRELQTVAESLSGGRSLSSPASSQSVTASDGVKSKEKLETERQSSGPTISKEKTNTRGKSISLGLGEKTGHTGADSGQTSAGVAEEDINSSSPVKKHKTKEEVILHSNMSDSLEAAVMDLEECLNKVKWLQKILQDHGVSSDAPTRRWKFLEPGATSKT